jgi:hypothetical protein
MKRTSLYLLLAFPFCAYSELKENKTPPAITVYTQFDQKYSATAMNVMRQELSAIMAPLGLEFTWRDLATSRGNEVSVELVVVTFKGECDTSGDYYSTGETGALGWTHISDGAILPFSDVDCDKIRRFINAEIKTQEPADREVVYGRAVGRVLAHELYHVFTNTTRHASWGVAKAFYSPKDLVSEKFQFQEKDTTALRAGKLKTLLRNRKPPVLGFSKR